MKELIAGLVLAGLMVLPAGLSRAADDVVATGKAVQFDYTLTVDNEQVETTEGKQPLKYVQGQGQIIPGLEKEMEGMKVGDARTIMVKSEEAYGPVREDALRDFKKADLPEGLKPNVGMILEMEDPEGNTYPAIIKEVKDETIVLDFNHPLAGKDLQFDVKIVSVNDAEPETKAEPESKE